MQGWRLAFETDFAAHWNLFPQLHMGFAAVTEDDVKIAVVDYLANVEERHGDLVSDHLKLGLDVEGGIVSYEFLHFSTHRIFVLSLSILL